MGSRWSGSGHVCELLQEPGQLARPRAFPRPGAALPLKSKAKVSLESSGLRGCSLRPLEVAMNWSMFLQMSLM